MIEIKAVIMSGGKGTRLRPLTCNLPKPMVPILNKPVMEYTINLLKDFNIKDIAVTLAYLPSSITNYFGDGTKFGVNLKYYIEEIPLGTGGSVKNAEDFLEDTFIVISGDAFTNVNLKRAINFHKEKKSKATLILKKQSIPLEYGVIMTDNDGKILRFLEKPSWGEVFSDTINTGIYILEPEIFSYYKKGENFDFSKDLFPKLLKDNVPMYGYVTKEYWCDIGNLSSYMDTHKDLLEDKVKIKSDYNEISKGIWVGENTVIENGVDINPPVYIGKNCTIKSKSKLGSYTVIGDNSFIDEEVSLKRSIVWNNAVILKNAELRGSVICNKVHIKNDARLFERSVVGSSSTISARASVKPNIKIWPCKTIDENAVISQNLIWSDKVSKKLFGNRNISGYLNIDITSEFASRLGSAFACECKSGNVFVIGSDNNNSSNIIKNSIGLGFISSGAYVININDVSLPMLRFAVRYFKANGGIYIRIDSKDINKVYIEFVNSKGINIDRNMERKIENSFSIENFTRCNSENIKEIINVENFSSLYLNEGQKILKNIKLIKHKSPKVLISSKSKYIMSLARRYLENIGCQVILDHSIYKYGSQNEYLKDISNLVISRQIDLGIIYSQSGENIILIDRKGKVLDKEKFALLSFLIGLKSGELSKVVVPYNFPRIVNDMVPKYDAEIVITKTSISDIMNKIIEKDSFYEYILNFDGIWASGKIIDFFVSKDMSLEDIMSEIPDFYFIKKQIPCNWKEKGKIVRLLVEDSKDLNIEMYEGVRVINDKGWILILPDNEKPVFNIYTEGFSEEYAEELSDFYIDKIKNLLKHST